MGVEIDEVDLAGNTVNQLLKPLRVIRAASIVNPKKSSGFQGINHFAVRSSKNLLTNWKI